MTALDKLMRNAEIFYFTHKYSLHSKLLLQIKNWTDQLDSVKNSLTVPEEHVSISDTNASWMGPGNFQAWINIKVYNIGKNLTR